MVLWAVTIKSCKAIPKLREYYDLMELWSQKGINFIKFVFEKDSKGKLHLHGSINLPAKYYRKSLFMRGFHFKLVHIYHEDGWDRYINKYSKCPPNEICTHDDNCLMLRLNKQRKIVGN